MKERRTHVDTYGGNARRTLLVYLGALAVLVGFVGFQARSTLFFPWTGRSRASACALGNSVYLVGGQGPGGAFLDDVIRMDTQTLRMRRVARLPMAMIGCEVVTANEALYVLGGYGGSTVFDSILRVDPNQRGTKTAGRLPSPRAFGAAVTAGDRIIYLGGWDGSRVLDEIVVFDPATGQARTAGHLPEPRQFAAAVLFQGRILLLGGEGENGEASADLLEVEPSTLAIMRTGRLPQPASRPRLAVLDNRVLCYDGLSDNLLLAFSALDSLTFERVALLREPLPVRDMNLGLAATSETAFLVGGSDSRYPRQPAFLRINMTPGVDRTEGKPIVEPLRLRTFLLRW